MGKLYLHPRRLLPGRGRRLSGAAVRSEVSGLQEALMATHDLLEGTSAQSHVQGVGERWHVARHEGVDYPVLCVPHMWSALLSCCTPDEAKWQL